MKTQKSEASCVGKKKFSSPCHMSCGMCIRQIYRMRETTLQIVSPAHTAAGTISKSDKDTPNISTRATRVQRTKSHGHWDKNWVQGLCNKSVSSIASWRVLRYSQPLTMASIRTTFITQKERRSAYHNAGSCRVVQLSRQIGVTHFILHISEALFTMIFQLRSR